LTLSQKKKGLLLSTDCSTKGLDSDSKGSPLSSHGICAGLKRFQSLPIGKSSEAHPLDSHPYLNPNLFKGCGFKTIDLSLKPTEDDEIKKASRVNLNEMVSIKALNENDGSSLEEEHKSIIQKMTMNSDLLLSVDSFFASWSTSEKNEENPICEKSSQNRRKNLPGLILQRVRSTCLAYFDSRNIKIVDDQEGRFTYVRNVMQKYTQRDLQKLKQYLNQYNKDWKTWKMVGKYLNGSGSPERMLREITTLFLENEGLNDFNEWIKNGKMAIYTKNEIQTGKVWLKEKFKELFEEQTELKDGVLPRKKHKL